MQKSHGPGTQKNRNSNSNFKPIKMSEEKTEVALISDQLTAMGVLAQQELSASKAYAKTLYMSKMIPEHYYKDKDEDTSIAAIVIALQYGSQVGLMGLTALQEITIIRGKPGLSGDATKALIKQSGLIEKWEESHVGEEFEDDFIHQVVVKRKGEKEQTHKFSVGDAKRAKLWGKTGPWTEYPKRMLMYRNIGFIGRDVFPDIMKGFKVTEELTDYPAEGVTTLTTKEGKKVEVKPQTPVAAAVADVVKNSTPEKEEANPNLSVWAGKTGKESELTWPEWNDEWEVLSEESLSRLKTAEAVYPILEDRGLLDFIPKGKRHTNKLFREIVLNHQRLNIQTSPPPESGTTEETPVAQNEPIEAKAESSQSKAMFDESIEEALDSFEYPEGDREFNDSRVIHTYFEQNDIKHSDVISALADLKMTDKFLDKEDLCKSGSREEIGRVLEYCFNQVKTE